MHSYYFNYTKNLKLVNNVALVASLNKGKGMEKFVAPLVKYFFNSMFR